MVPVASESYSRLGSEGYLYLKKLARKTSVLAGGDGVVAPSLLFAQCACRLSVCLHRCNVRMLRKGVGGVQATGGSLRAALAVWAWSCFSRARGIAHEEEEPPSDGRRGP